MSGARPPADAASLPVEGLERREFAPPPRVPFRVRLAPGVHEAVWAHGRESLDRELCGVLLGRLYRDGTGPFLEVRDWVRGEHARSEGAQVTFTHETWDYIHEEIRRRHPKDPPDIVGWYHTHPGFGIFLSEMDLFIHSNFFSGPGQVALVLDPRSGEEGMFGWVEGRIERLPSHWVGDRPVGCAAAGAGAAPASAPPAAPADSDELDLGRAVSGIRFGTVLALLWGVLLGWLASGWLQAWQARSYAAAAAEAEVQGLVRAGILSGAQERNLREVAARAKALAESLPPDPAPAAPGAPPGPRAAALALAGDAERLARAAAERNALIDRALGSRRLVATSGELAARVELQAAEVRRLRSVVEILTLSAIWAELDRAVAEGRIPPEAVEARRAPIRESLARIVREDPGSEAAVRQAFPGALPEKSPEPSAPPPAPEAPK